MSLVSVVVNQVWAKLKGTDSGGTSRKVRTGTDGRLETTIGDKTTAGQTAAVNVSGQVAIQNPPNLDAAASTLATSAKQDTLIGHVDGLETLITAIKDTDGVKKITDALPTGDNSIGRVKLTDGGEVASVDDHGGYYPLHVKDDKLLDVAKDIRRELRQLKMLLAAVLDMAGEEFETER